MSDSGPELNVSNDYLHPHYPWNPDLPPLIAYRFPPPVPIYNQPAYGNLGYQDSSLPYAYRFPPPVPIYNQPAYGNLGYQDSSLPYEFRFPPPPLPNYNPVYNTSASYELPPRHDYRYPPPAPNYYPISLPPYNVQEVCSTIPTPPGLGCWQPPPGFNYQCVQLPFPASGFLNPSLNIPPIGNEGMHSMHTLQLPPGAPVSHDRSPASIIDSSTVHPHMSAQQLTLNQQTENHNQEQKKLLARQLSLSEDENLDQAVASIFRVSAREAVRSRRMPRRPRPPVARQVCCYRDTMSVKKCDSNNRIKAPASQSSKTAFRIPLHSTIVAEKPNGTKSISAFPPPMIASDVQLRRSVQHLPRPTPRYACNIRHSRE